MQIQTIRIAARLVIEIFPQLQEQVIKHNLKILSRPVILIPHFGAMHDNILWFQNKP